MTTVSQYNSQLPTRRKKIKNPPHKNFMATQLHTSRFLPRTSRPSKKAGRVQSPPHIKTLPIYTMEMLPLASLIFNN